MGTISSLGIYFSTAMSAHGRRIQNPSARGQNLESLYETEKHSRFRYFGCHNSMTSVFPKRLLQVHIAMPAL